MALANNQNNNQHSLLASPMDTQAEQILEPVTDQHMARLKPSGVVRSPIVRHRQILSRI